ncbi:HesA/MoeB/ThiF family protein [Luminiphilus sp.]|nr:HesA/MoeB/ThiF family protein [Luminiphilus sp.]
MDTLTDHQLARYARQLVMPQVDLDGQMRLQRSCVLVVGAGGLGCPVTQYLAGAGVGHIRVVDPDQVELSNLPRQVVYTEADIGAPKVNALTNRLRAANTDIELEGCMGQFDPESSQALLDGVDLVIDASDSMQARLDIDRSTYERQLPWLMGAAVQTAGQWIAFDPARQMGCYHCLGSADGNQALGGCATLGILGPVVGMIAMQQSLAALKYLLGASLPWGVLHYIDGWSVESSAITLSARPDCPLCGKGG